VVLVDAPTYHLAFRVMLDHGVELVTATTDHDGPVPEALAEQVAALRGAGRRVPMLYLVPTFGNPTGRSLPQPRRAELVDLAGRAELTLVEDDTYRELVYEGVAPPSLWSLAAHEHVVRLGSFAKTVAPGLRLGWINAAPSVVDRLTRLGYVHSGGGVNHTTALAMGAFGASGAYDAHVESVRRAYAGQRDALVGALAATLPGDVPDGGWFLWRELPAGLTAADLLPVAERHGTSFVPGGLFHADGLGGAHHIRLSYSLLTADKLAEAGRRLAVAIAESRPAAG
jgi:DNA-binding transcriptional MocR family regulator